MNELLDPSMPANAVDEYLVCGLRGPASRPRVSTRADRASGECTRMSGVADTKLEGAGKERTGHRRTHAHLTARPAKHGRDERCRTDLDFACHLETMALVKRDVLRF